MDFRHLELFFIIISATSSIAGGLAYSAMFTIEWKHGRSIFSLMGDFWQPEVGIDPFAGNWIRKYAPGLPVYTEWDKWRYLGVYTPAFKERFPYSTTLFVGLTSGFKAMQSVSNFGWYFPAIAMSYYGDFAALVIMIFCRYIAFNLGNKLFKL